MKKICPNCKQELKKHDAGNWQIAIIGYICVNDKCNFYGIMRFIKKGVKI